MELAVCLCDYFRKKKLINFVNQQTKGIIIAIVVCLSSVVIDEVVFFRKK